MNANENTAENMQIIKGPIDFDFDVEAITSLEEAKAILNLQKTVIKIMAGILEFRDGSSGDHVGRTQKYLGALIKELIKSDIFAEELDTWNLWLALTSAQLHDIGKIGIRDKVLLKPGALDADEFAHVKEHAAIGEKIFDIPESDQLTQSFLEHARFFAGTHHEKWDGSGYPHGLKGNEIPLQGRIMAIADVYDALVTERPYKKAFSHDKAVEIIKNGKGTHFDPNLVDVFLIAADEFKKISQENPA